MRYVLLEIFKLYIGAKENNPDFIFHTSFIHQKIFVDVKKDKQPKPSWCSLFSIVFMGPLLCLENNFKHSKN
jgi:hypothetical protein